MRLDPVLHAFYLLGSLRGGMPASPVCPVRSHSLSALMAAPADWRSAPAQAVTAFIDVNVVPMDTERVLANQIVLVEGDRITALGPAAQVKVPAGAVRIDGRGKYLMPGLADMHVHAGNYNDIDRSVGVWSIYLANGVTTLRSFNPLAPAVERTLKTITVLHPHIYVPPRIDLKTMPLDSIASYVSAYKAAGYRFIYVDAGYIRQRDSTKRTLYDSLLVAAQRVGLSAASHTNNETAQALIAFGAYGGSVEHLHHAFKDVVRRPPEDVPESEIQALAATVRRAGTWLSITLDCVEYRDRGIGKRIANIKTTRRLVKALQDAGVRMLLGADADGAHGWSPSVVHEELAAMVRAGLTPYQALLTGTRNVAQYFSLLDSSGTVAVGKRADLVLLPGNPLQSLRYAREPVGVMIAGRWLDRATLDRSLLASPKAWFKDLWGGAMPLATTYEQGAKTWEHQQKFDALADSPELAEAPSGSAARERLLRSLTDELGAIRATLTPEQREVFDPAARVWMREHIRQGYRLVVAGVAPTP
jgi:imidazolonepropionase-like amidohydrolase